jgi:hypothetical protein
MRTREVTHLGLPPHFENRREEDNQWVDDKGRSEKRQSLATAKRLYKRWLMYRLAGKDVALTIWRRGRLESDVNSWIVVAMMDAAGTYYGWSTTEQREMKLTKRILDNLSREVQE